jgi:hypothetical protein
VFNAKRTPIAYFSATIFANNDSNAEYTHPMIEGIGLLLVSYFPKQRRKDWSMIKYAGVEVENSLSK